MKVLQINVFYKEGSTGKIVGDVENSLQESGFEMISAYGRGNTIHPGKDSVFRFCFEKEAWFHNLFVILGLSLPYGGSPLGTIRLKKYIKRVRPDVVHIHCINGSCVNIYKILSFLAKKEIPTVVTHHGEFYYTGSCGHSFECNKWFESQCKNCEFVRYATQSRTISRTHEAWKMMQKTFAKFKPEKLVFTAVSPWVKKRSELSPIVNKYRCEVVKNGLDTGVFYYRPNNRLFEKIGARREKKMVLHSTASFWPANPEHVKGGWYVVELAKRFPNVLFIIVSLKNAIDGELPSNVFLWGSAKDQNELAELYSTADITLLTSKRETFSMVCAESLCCGTPVVGFKAGGPESIAIKEYADFVDYGDIDALEKAVNERLCLNEAKEYISEVSKRVFDKSKMATEYSKIYQSFFL